MRLNTGLLQDGVELIDLFGCEFGVIKRLPTWLL